MERGLSLFWGSSPVVRIDCCPQNNQLLIQQVERYGIVVLDWERCLRSLRSVGLAFPDQEKP